MRLARANRTDANQREVVRALEKCGVTVQPLNAIGDGCPDLLCGFRGTNYLLEVKDGGKCQSKRALTPDQIEWGLSWKGDRPIVVASVAEALAAVGAVDVLVEERRQ